MKLHVIHIVNSHNVKILHSYTHCLTCHNSSSTILHFILYCECRNILYCYFPAAIEKKFHREEFHFYVMTCEPTSYIQLFIVLLSSLVIILNITILYDLFLQWDVSMS